MPVSGHEETGVKSFAGQFCGLIAGVPIKKRRFPLIRPSSPLAEEPCSVTEENEFQRKENSSISQGSTLSNASIAGAPIKKRRFPILQDSSSPLEEGSPAEESDALRKEHSSASPGSTLFNSSSGLSDTIGNPVLEERKASSGVTDANMVQISSCLLRPKIEEPNLATQSCTLDAVDSKGKVIFNEGYDKKLGSKVVKGNPELLLAAKEGLALHVSKQNVQEICKQQTPVVPESTSLSLGLKEHFFPAIASPEIEEGHPEIEKVESVSLELSLSKEEGSTHSLHNDAKINSNTAHAYVHSNRANWDLNTTMDAWEESGTDVSSVKTSIEGPKIAQSVHGDNKFMCSTVMAPPTSVSVMLTREGSQNKAFVVSPGLHGQQYKFVDPHNLCTTSYYQKYAEELSRLSVKQNSGTAIPAGSLSGMFTSVGDVNTSSFRLVKREPFDENSKRDLNVANACPVGLLDSIAVKQEFVQHSVAESSKLSNLSNLNLVDPKCIKSEPGHKTAESKIDQLGKELLQGSDNCSCAMALPITSDATLVSLETTHPATQISADTAHPPLKPLCSAELTVSELENFTRTEGLNIGKVSHGGCSNAEQVPAETAPAPMVDDGTYLTDPGMKGSSILTKEENSDDADGCRLKLMNEPPPDPRDIGEGCVSDEEKITLSADMLEDVSYGSDYESDDNHAVTVAVDTEQYVEDDDYEDGEVREPLEHSTAEDTICEVREVVHPDCSNYENKQMEKGAGSDDHPTSSHVVENDSDNVMSSELNRGEHGLDIEMQEKPGKVIDKNVCLQESVADEKPSVASDGKRPVNLLPRKPLDTPERKNVSKAVEIELSSDQAANSSNGVDVVQCADEVVKTADTVGQTNVDLPKMEVSANTDDATKDVSSGGNQGRIIDLSRAASSSSPSKTRSISGRSLPARAGRDVLSDTLEGEKLPRGRDEVYIDGPRRFSRERHQDMSPRNSRLSFVRGRGRVNSRLDTLRGEWESDREFSGEFYNGPGQFRGPRAKYASAIADTDLGYNNVAPDGSYVGNGRMGRKPLNDGSYIAPRRRSPVGREGIQMGHRIPRTMSPSRCVGGDGSELVGMRHSEKFLRGFPEDTLDSMFTRPQPYEGMDGRFTRGSRNFSSIQRRGLARIRSKSPIRSRSRSPGPWSSPRRRSPRRRSPDGFSGHPDLTHRRSPLYRVDRMRSPDRPIFQAERVVRRHGSPPYLSRPSNDMRDIDSAREDSHPRSVISNRSPSGRILIRNRRFDVVDPRDRADNDDEYFGGPMHSGRILELSGEGNGEERRRFGERRGPVRSFRPPYNGDVGEDFHLDEEDGPRHYRFCSDDSDFHERGNNLRERDFDRRIKGRPANVPPRRSRNIDEQEENFRHGGQVWSDDSFDDISRVKRKRF